MLWAILLAAGTDAITMPASPPATLGSTAVVPAPSEDGFRIGVDTMGTVTAKLGKPYFVQSSSDGTRIALYITTRMHVKGASFIPYVGLFAGGAKASSSTKTFIFDGTGLLKSFSSSSTSTDCHTTVVGAACK